MCITVTSRVLLCSHCSPTSRCRQQLSTHGVHRGPKLRRGAGAVADGADGRASELPHYRPGSVTDPLPLNRNSYLYIIYIYSYIYIYIYYSYFYIETQKGGSPWPLRELAYQILSGPEVIWCTTLIGPNLGHMCNYTSSKWAIQVGQKWFPLFDKCVCIIYGWFSIAMIDSGTPTSQLAWSTGSSATEISSSPGNLWDYRRNDIDLWWCSWIFHAYDML